MELRPSIEGSKPDTVVRADPARFRNRLVRIGRMVYDARSHDETELAVRKRQFLGVSPLDASVEVVMIEYDTIDVHGALSEIHRGDECARSRVLHRQPTGATSDVEYPPTPPCRKAPEPQRKTFDAGLLDPVKVIKVRDRINGGVLVGQQRCTFPIRLYPLNLGRCCHEFRQ